MGCQLSSFVQRSVSFRRMRVVHSDHASSNPALTCTCRKKIFWFMLCSSLLIMTMAKILVKLRHATHFELWWSLLSNRQSLLTTIFSISTLTWMITFHLVTRRNTGFKLFIMLCFAERDYRFLLQQNEIPLVSSIAGMVLSVLKRNIGG